MSRFNQTMTLIFSYLFCFNFVLLQRDVYYPVPDYFYIISSPPQLFYFFQVNQEDVTVTKSGYTTVKVTQTIPLGCKHSENDSPDCSTSLSLYDSNLSENPCDAGISVVNADDDDMCVNEIEVQHHARLSYNALQFDIKVVLAKCIT